MSSTLVSAPMRPRPTTWWLAAPPPLDVVEVGLVANLAVLVFRRVTSHRASSQPYSTRDGDAAVSELA
jgi:hypothetical protein